MKKRPSASPDESDQSVFLCALQSTVPLEAQQGFRLEFMARLLEAGITSDAPAGYDEVADTGELLITISQTDYLEAGAIAAAVAQEMGILNGHLMPFAESAGGSPGPKLKPVSRGVYPTNSELGGQPLRDEGGDCDFPMRW